MKTSELTLETKRDILHEMFYKWPDLIKWLEEMGIYTAPAAKIHHGAYEGGLFDHSLQVTYELKRMTDKLKLKWERPESPVLVGMLHDVCKLNDYILNGENIERNQESLYTGHGEKSLLMLMGHINLTEEETMCIRYHMGAFTNSDEWPFYTRALKKYPNVLWTHTADMVASQIKDK